MVLDWGIAQPSKAVFRRPSWCGVLQARNPQRAVSQLSPPTRSQKGYSKRTTLMPALKAEGSVSEPVLKSCLCLTVAEQQSGCRAHAAAHRARSAAAEGFTRQVEVSERKAQVCLTLRMDCVVQTAALAD